MHYCCVLLCVVVCCCVCCGLAVRAVVVVAVDVAVCVRFFLSGTEKRSRVYVQNAPVTVGTVVLKVHTGVSLPLFSCLYPLMRLSLLVSLSPLMCLSSLFLSLFISLSFSSLSQ